MLLVAQYKTFLDEFTRSSIFGLYGISPDPVASSSLFLSSPIENTRESREIRGIIGRDRKETRFLRSFLSFSLSSSVSSFVTRRSLCARTPVSRFRLSSTSHYVREAKKISREFIPRSRSSLLSSSFSSSSSSSSFFPSFPGIARTHFAIVVLNRQ